MFRLSGALRRVVFKHQDQGGKNRHKYVSHPGFPTRDSRSRSHARNKTDEGPKHKI